MRNKSTSGANADLVKPQKKKLALPADIYFPMQHAAALIHSAKTGQSHLAANLYDGSEKGEKYYVTNAVIGKKYAQGAIANAAAIKDAAKLEGLASWPVAISYFETGKDKEDTPPAYELSFRYYENGVTRSENRLRPVRAQRRTQRTQRIAARQMRGRCAIVLPP